MEVEGRRVDPDVAAVLAGFPSFAGDIAQRRAAIDALLDARPISDDDPEVSRTVIDAGGVTVRVYRPTSVRGPMPAVLEIHGGGYTIGHIDLEDDTCAQWCRSLGCVVVTVDYRLAPEHPYPAALDDCCQALAWVHAEADQLGVDRSRVAVAGASAGGGLAAAVALRSRDEGGPPICFQVLVYPEIDDRSDNQSSRYELEGLNVFDRSGKERSWRAYLGDRYGGDVPAHAAPARASDLTGLPPAYVLVAELDPLRDEGLDYAVAMVRAGVAVELHHVPGVPHGWDRLAPTAALSRRCTAEVIEVLRAAFGTARR